MQFAVCSLQFAITIEDLLLFCGTKLMRRKTGFRYQTFSPYMLIMLATKAPIDASGAYTHRRRPTLC